MKKKFVSCQQQYCFFLGNYGDWLALFNMVVCCKREGRKRKERNGLNYPISGIITPETDTKRNMMRAGHGARLRRCRTVISKAWMD